MLHRLQSVSQPDPVMFVRRWLSCLVLSALACGASAGAQEIVRAPGWLAIMPDDSQPVVPEVRAKGREWFMDASRGDDFGTGSKQQPWKTFGKLKRAGLASGDVVRLKCGSVWRESVSFDARALPAGVTIAAQEGCDADKAPSIRGSDLVDATWQPDGSQLGAFVTDRFGAVKGLAYKGQRMIAARLPNYGGPGKEFALAEGRNDRRSFRLRDAERRAIGDRDLVGATVYVRVVAWQVEKAEVRSYDAVSGTVTLDKDLNFPIKNGAGYILEGKRWMLDSPGEWWHDNQAKRLYLAPPGGQRPQPGDVEATVRDHALWVGGGVSKLKVVGIDLRQTVMAALDVQDASDVAFDGLSIVDPGEFGLIVSRSARVAFRGGRIVGSGRNAILTRDAPEGVISGNLILDHGLLGRADGSAAAIVVKGARTVVSGNVVRRSANPGIHFTNLEGTQVRNNIVVQPCLRMSDCGGIQTWTGHSPELATRRRMVRSVVKDNVVLGGPSSLEGASGGGRNQSVGIYLDEMTGGVQVQGNVIAGTENGIYLHNAQFNDIVGNTVRSVAHSSVTAHMSLPDADVIRGNRVRGNRLFSRSTPTGGREVFAFKWQQRSTPERLFSGDDANEVQENQILRASNGGQTRWYVGESLSAQAISEPDWRKYAKTEREQVINVAPDSTPKKASAESANVLPDGDFRTGNASWKAYFHPSGRGGVVEGAKCDGGPCLKFVAGHVADALSSKPFQLESSAGRNDYLLKFTVKAGATGGSLRVAVRRNGPPYDNFGVDQPVVKLSPGQVFQAEVPFQASNSDPARVDFQAEPGAQLYLSRASLTRVDAAASDSVTVAGSLFVINLMDKTQTVACAAAKLPNCAALDEQGKDVKWPLTLAPGQSMAMFPRKSGN